MPKIKRQPSKSRTVSGVCTTAAGSPGPFERKIPSGLYARIFSGFVREGKTLISEQRFCSSRKLFSLQPRSIAAIRGPAGLSPLMVCSVVREVANTQSGCSVLRFAINVAARLMAAASDSADTIAPQGVPCSRNFKVKARVSTSVKIGTRLLFRRSLQDFSRAEFCISTHTKPSIQTCRDSQHASLAP